MKTLIAVLILIATAVGAQEYVQKTNSLIPGLYQSKTGQHAKAKVLVALQAASVLTYAYCDAQDPHDKWGDVIHSQTDRERQKRMDAYNRADDLKNFAPTAGWIAVGVFAANVFDALVYKQPTTGLRIGPTNVAMVVVF